MKRLTLHSFIAINMLAIPSLNCLSPATFPVGPSALRTQLVPAIAEVIFPVHLVHLARPLNEGRVR